MAVPSVSLVIAMLARSSGHAFDRGYQHGCSSLDAHSRTSLASRRSSARESRPTRRLVARPVGCCANDGGDIMVHKITIALAALAFAGAIAAAMTADARMGGGGGIGPRGGGIGGGGMRGAVMGGGGVRSAMVGGGVRSAMVGGGF